MRKKRNRELFQEGVRRMRKKRNRGLGKKEVA